MNKNRRTTAPPARERATLITPIEAAVEQFAKRSAAASAPVAVATICEQSIILDDSRIQIPSSFGGAMSRTGPFFGLSVEVGFRVHTCHT